MNSKMMEEGSNQSEGVEMAVCHVCEKVITTTLTEDMEKMVCDICLRPVCSDCESKTWGTCVLCYEKEWIDEKGDTEEGD